MSWDVGPIGLSTTRMPSRPGPERGARHRQRVTAAAACGPRRGPRPVPGRRGAARSRRPPGHARPHRTAPVSTVASTPPGLVRTLIRVASPASLNRIATSASSAWASRSMMPSDCGGSVPVASRSASSRVDATTSPSSYALEPIQDATEQAQLSRRLRAVQPARDVGQRRAGLDQRRRHGERARRRVRVRERRGVHDDPGHQRRRQRRRPTSSGTPRRTASSATISQVAAACGSIQSASPSASFEAWWSMTTRGSRSNSSRWRSPTAPTRSSVPQSETTSRS